MEIVLAGTGHRPKDMLPPGAEVSPYDTAVMHELVELCRTQLREIKPVKVISGMAMGFDTALATAAYRESIPFVAAVPFEGQDSKWNTETQKIYRALLSKASEVVIVTPGEYSAQKMQARNVWMADNCTHILALWKGTRGGTANCLDYVHKLARPVRNIWPLWAKALA